jgi:hypothetical protein
MNLYWIKLDLARLKSTDIPIEFYMNLFTFLEPRIDQDLWNEIYFLIFWVGFKLYNLQ